MKPVLFIFSLLFFLTPLTNAQLCNGSLGDPVVHITFGGDGVAGGPLKNGVTNMTFVNGCPNDGEYTITALSFGCFGNTWHLLAGDHTHDMGGRYMLINASFEPSDFYVDTVRGLCSNTTYEFASWVMNVLKPTSCAGFGIRPNLTFRIETTSGTILQQFNSGDIPPDEFKTWKQYGTFFRTPANVTSVVLRLTNNAKGGCGNDLALDDITFRACGPKIEALANNAVTETVDLCENDNKDINFTASYSGGFTDPVLQWQVSIDTGRTWVDITNAQTSTYIRKPTKKGWYQYRVVTAERGSFGSAACRIASNVTHVFVHGLPQKKSLPLVMGCTSSNLQLEAYEGSELHFQWTGPNGFSDTTRTPILHNVSFKDSGLYTVVITTAEGCTAKDSFPVKVFPGIKATVNPDNNICEGSSVTLEASGNGAIKYNWYPSTGLSNNNIFNPVASPHDTTVYKIVVTNKYGCQDSSFTSVNIWKHPIVDAGAGKQIFEGDSAMLDGKLSGTSVNFYWSPSVSMRNGNTLTPIVSPADNTTYTLFATSPFGCGAVSDDVFVKVFKKIVAPNSFSPNGDGINDTWQIKGLDSYTNPSLKIFTRYGQLVYETRNYSSGWNGTYKGRPLPVGTYYYLIDVHLNIPPVTGWLLIVR